MSSPRDTIPRIVNAAAELRRIVRQARQSGQMISLVPTMGALHAGHISLADAASRGGGLTVVSIFVNPTQFGPGEDFSRYPRNLEADLNLLKGHGAQLVFTPSTEEVYRPGNATHVEVAGPAIGWEGEFRPGHFRGVATVVLKLLNLVEPDRAYFGRKDYQQSLVVRRMVADLDRNVEIVVCPTVREPDGLAMSSRNVYLSSGERQRALAIWKSLQMAKQQAATGVRDAETVRAGMIEMLSRADLKIDYVALVDPESLESVERLDRPTVALIAARVGATRLIDNETII